MNLSFATDGKWNPIRTGDRVKDVDHGKECAKETLGLMLDSGNPLILNSVSKIIIEGGTYDAVEVGFYSEIGLFIADQQADLWGHDHQAH